ncbi:hypothetical protein [Streptomyces zaomyceticus]|uniref:hypothetical protein n=1 Tax=Streptomyces zaomyceticus TaxID=68286 RepID=UPI0037ACFFA1
MSHVALLWRRAGVSEVPPSARKARKRPRLTALHRDVLVRVEEHGALSAVDLVRAPFSQSHQDSRWWMVRLAHLFDHRLIAEVRDGGEEARGLVRATSDLERDLDARLDALHKPGPVWDGERVLEPAPPEGWAELRDSAGHEAARLDQEALRRRADYPFRRLPATGGGSRRHPSCCRFVSVGAAATPDPQQPVCPGVPDLPGRAIRRAGP